ncbi:hypothetical protein DY000_02020796 [Brassica cretica]|uniref:Uncharacterized protein n=1 Tax=Brassica cretica TaxID=69181 RepID=A0ABQ7E7J5_BRACR|nr:hypothetical protein DY000_02020796 [Brassica cretica]
MNRHKKPPWPGDHRRLAHKPKLELKIWIQGIVLLDMAGIRYDSDDFVKTIVLVCGGSIWQQGSIQNHGRKPRSWRVKTITTHVTSCSGSVWDAAAVYGTDCDVTDGSNPMIFEKKRGFWSQCMTAKNKII